MHTCAVNASPKFAGTSAAVPHPYARVATVPVQLALGLRSLTLVDDDAELRSRFAYALRSAMARKGWKPSDLADAIRRDESTVSRWTTEKSVPNIFVIKALAEALEVRPDLLFDPPPLPEYPLADYLIDRAVIAGVVEGRRRAGSPSTPVHDEPAQPPERRSRAG